MRVKCRIWWPKQLLSSRPTGGKPFPSLMFGWFLPHSPSSSSIDIVVAFAIEEEALSRLNSSALEDAVLRVRERMPVCLQDKSAFSLLGQCVRNSTSNNDSTECEKVDNGKMNPPFLGKIDKAKSVDDPAEGYNRRGFGCSEVNTLQHQGRRQLLLPLEARWIQLVYDPYSCPRQGIGWLPKLHYIIWNGKMTCQFDLHVIAYETPRLGGQHFSSAVSSSKCLKHPLRRPEWVDDLSTNQKSLDLDVIFMSINCSMAAHALFDGHLGLQESRSRPSIFYIFLNIVGHLLAAVIATLSTSMYILLQLLNSLTSLGSKWISITPMCLFRNTRRNIQLRCSQIYYWPIFLQRAGFRSSSSVEYAEKAVLQEHSMLSSLAVDIILGNLVGLLLLFHSEQVCQWILLLASGITSDVLRTGCAWLMGVPAGFKLNNELAGVLGMISLNAIQIWSTLWSSVIYIFPYIIKSVALSGILFGMTVVAAIITDLISIASMHVYALHWLMSLVYSHQIQALAALWRLFKGRKWNPLRQRLDSYNYTVEQHVVGSLIFTPLLLLVPTTSVFYMFFSIMNTSVIFLLALIEVTIAVIHVTPYNRIFLWLLKRKRFPSGFWFEIICCQSTLNASSAASFNDETYPVCEIVDKDETGSDTTTLVSVLQSNTLTIGQLLRPHYMNLLTGIRETPMVQSIYGVLIGKSLPALLETALPSPMPWISIPFKEYWLICYESLNFYLGC